MPSANQRFICKLAIVLFIGIFLCTAAHILVHKLPSSEQTRELVHMFDLDTERNLPTWFASELWLLTGVCAILCYFAERKEQSVGGNRRRFSLMWLVIGSVFVAASADEVAMIHENFGQFLEDFRGGGLLAQATSIGQHLQSSPDSPWIIYYLPILALFGIAAFAFLAFRMKKQRLLLVLCLLSINCYAIALAMDHYQGRSWQEKSAIAVKLGTDMDSAVDISIVIEETLENIGNGLLICAFATYAFNIYRKLSTNNSNEMEDVDVVSTV